MNVSVVPPTTAGDGELPIGNSVPVTPVNAGFVPATGSPEAIHVPFKPNHIFPDPKSTAIINSSFAESHVTP